MIIIINGNYNEETAATHMAAVLLEDFGSEEVTGFISTDVKEIDEMPDGSYFKELRRIEALLHKLNALNSPIRTNVDCIVLNEYINFNNPDAKTLCETLSEKYRIPIIGVVTNGEKIRKIIHAKIVRNNPEKPLYVTAFGCDNSVARRYMQNMTGGDIPYAIELSDALANKKKVQFY